MEQLPKIVQQRLQPTAKAGVHPDPDLLTAFAEKSLNQREHAQVLQHLGQCSDCRNVISLATPEVEPDPSTIPARSRWLSWPVLRWGALAAGVVVVSAAVTLHYQQPRGAALSVAEKAAVPVPSSNVTVERQIPTQPREKLAAKIVPSLPLQADRDFAGKLAKQREGADTRSAAAASASNGLTKEEDELKKSPTANSRLANADTLRSADKSGMPLGQLAANAPVPSAPPAAKALGGSQVSQRKDAPDYVARGAAEAITVQSQAASMPSTATAGSKAKDESPKNESGKEFQRGSSGAAAAMSPGDQKADTASAGLDGGAYDRRSRAKTLDAQTKAMPRWTLSPAGALLRSFDSGGTWQTIPVANNVVFQALAANDSDIWVGGSAGALYHSTDAGQHWTQIEPVADGKPLSAAIIKIEFTDAHGRLTTNTNETWATSDGGASWHRQ